MTPRGITFGVCRTCAGLALVLGFHLSGIPRGATPQAAGLRASAAASTGPSSSPSSSLCIYEIALYRIKGPSEKTELEPARLVAVALQKLLGEERAELSGQSLEDTYSQHKNEQNHDVVEVVEKKEGKFVKGEVWFRATGLPHSHELEAKYTHRCPLSGPEPEQACREEAIIPEVSDIIVAHDKAVHRRGG